MVNGPGTVILMRRSVWRSRNFKSSTCTECIPRILPTILGTGFGAERSARQRAGFNHALPVRILLWPLTTESSLLAADTRVPCPACEQEFSLEQGFAKQALEAVEAASAGALAALKDEERAAVE